MAVEMERFNLFPTLVCKYKYDETRQFEDIFNQHENKYLLSTDRGVDAGEHTGFNAVHKEPAFSNLYAFIARSVNHYMTELAMDTSKYRIIIGKSWLSYVDNVVDIEPHNHADHHISFIYYVDDPTGMDYIHFGNTHQPNINQPFHGAFNPGPETNVDGRQPNIKEWNAYNSFDTGFQCEEGDLWVFPGKLSHWTKTKRTPFDKEKRRAIAGDVLLVYKDPSNRMLFGIYDPSHWTVYDVK